MTRYIEAMTAGPFPHPVLVRLDSIKTAEPKGKDVTVINNGIHLAMPYEKVRQIIDADDFRQVVDYSWPPVLLYLSRRRVCDLIKQFGPTVAQRLLAGIIDCQTDTEIHELLRQAEEALKEEKTND